MASETDVERIVRAHQAGVWRYLRLLGCEAAAADDLTQDAFLALLDSDFEERSEAETAAFLRTVARNLFLKSLRREVRQRSLGDLEMADAVWDGTAGREGGGAQLAAMERCLETLDERMRRALDLRYASSLSRVEIAVALSMGEEGAKTLLRRAKDILRDCMERRLEHDTGDHS